MNRIFLLLAVLALAITSAAPAQAAGMGVIRDEEIEQSLRAFSTPVFVQAGLSPSAVRFILVDRNDLNAFVAGGQNIFLFTGLLLKTTGPDEVTGVVAHETGHIAHGDLIRIKTEMSNLSFQMMAATLLGIAVAAGTGKGDAGIAVASAAGTVGERTLLRHSRMQETAADQAGVSYLLAAQLPVTGMLSFMEKLADQELLPESQQSEYVRTHPLTQDRVSYLQGAAEQAAKRRYNVPAEWNEMHRRMIAKLKGFIFPDQAMLDKGDSVAARYGRAIALYRKGSVDAALKILDPLLKEEPKNPYFYELKGQMLFEHGRIEESIPAYAKAAGFAPHSGLIRAAYGHALMESRVDPKKRLDEAASQFQLALRSEPQDSQSHHFLGIVYGKQGNEGMSRLHLAEEQLLKGQNDFAIREAKLAQAALPKSSPGFLRASDILEAARRSKKDKKGD